jgi:lanthionine synthetase-like protein/protein kinase-like protein
MIVVTHRRGVLGLYPWETAFRYSLFHERWFESADRYSPGDEHLAIFWEVMPIGWTLRRNGMALVALPPHGDMPGQGWKLHVSANSDQAAQVLRRALPVLADAGARFKFLADRRLVHVSNSKLCSRGASGKFITVYPRDDAQFRRLGTALAAALDGFTGPYVLSDRRIPGSRCVFYRYGGFQALWKLHQSGTRVACIRNPAGELVPDVRNPFFGPPPWVKDPFGPGEDHEDGSIALADGRFLIEEALGFSNRGGVYRAYDRDTDQDVVIKEARPLVELDAKGSEAVACLAKEYDLLRTLEDTGYFARPVAYFTEWEHAFLAEEYVRGSHLGAFTITHNPLYRTGLTQSRLTAYWERMRPLWVQLAEAIRQAHDRGVVLGDVSFTNVMVPEEGGQLKIIDLEAAVRPGIDPPVHLFTFGLASDRFVRTGVCDRANDYHALGGIILGSLTLQHSFLGFHPHALPQLLEQLTTDLGLPGEIPELITYLRSGTVAAPPGVQECPDHPGAVIHRIKALRLRSADIRPPALAAPAQESVADEHLAKLRKEAEQTLSGICSYITAVADPHRADRLFPADLMVFETNPLSIAYGACGVTYALHRITGQVAAPLRAWLLRQPFTGQELPPGLYTGQAGIAWVLDTLGYTELALRILAEASRHELLWASTDVFGGAAGFGMACLHLWQRTGKQWLLDEAARAGSRLAAARRRDDRGSFWPDDQDRVHVGFAYGNSGIAAFLLYLSLATKDTALLDASRDALRFDLAQAGRIDGELAGFPALAATGQETTGVLKGYWDEGSAGVGTALLRYLTVQDDAALRTAVTDITLDTCRKYAVLPQLFHGLAGAGNYLLDLWEFSGDARYLAEAWRTAEGVLLFRIERPEGFAFPGEQAMRETTDLATGSAGVGLFLHRLLHTRAGSHSNFNFLPDALLPPTPPGAAPHDSS